MDLSSRAATEVDSEKTFRTMRREILVSAWTVAFFILMGDGLAQHWTGPRQVLSLDGIWEIVFDPDNEGRRSGWYIGAVFLTRSERMEIRV